MNGPERSSSPKNTYYEYALDKAIKLLDDAGWKPYGADGVREKNGVKLHAIYQTSINAPRQKTQEIVKQTCQKAGISVEIKSVTAIGVLLFGCGKSGHLSAFRCRPPDVHHDDGPARSCCVHRQFLSTEVAEQGKQVPGTQHHPLAECHFDKLFQQSDVEAQSV